MNLQKVIILMILLCLIVPAVGASGPGRTILSGVPTGVAMISARVEETSRRPIDHDRSCRTSHRRGLKDLRYTPGGVPSFGSGRRRQVA
jgi:hypothetical protein